MTEHEILKHVKESGGRIPYLKLLNIGRTGDAHDTFKNEDLIRQLISEGILSGKPGADNVIAFGKMGRLRLDQLNQLQKQSADEAAKAAEEKRSQRRHDWAIAIFSTLGGALLSDPLWDLLHFLLDLIK